MVKGPVDFTSMADLKPTLTTAGTDAYLQAVEAKLVGCAQYGVMLPNGCINGVRETAGQKIDKKSVNWTFDKDSMASNGQADQAAHQGRPDSVRARN